MSLIVMPPRNQDISSRMTTTDNNVCLMIGLPSTGKTTYLAALYFALESAEDDRDLRLRLLPSDRRYLNDIAERWASLKEQERTKRGSEQQVILHLENASGFSLGDIAIPDLSGETYDTFLRDREWSLKFDQAARMANGAALFIHPEQVKEPSFIAEENVCADSIRGENAQATVPPPESAQQRSVPWEYGFTPTSVSLVSLLQFFIKSPIRRKDFRLSVIISAWDLALREKRTPTEWVETRLPLLDQFLKSNVDQLNTKIFGISAQGGSLDTENSKLSAFHNPCERIIVADGETNHHDIAAPIMWLLSTQEEENRVRA